MTNEERRIAAASLLRELGHTFADRTLSDDQLDRLSEGLRALLDQVGDAPRRVREFSRNRLQELTLSIPSADEIGDIQLFSDSFVAGAANPMGLAAQLWREGDVACMQVTLGKSFEGAPGRAHGGVVAALLDEVMGVVNVMHGNMAFTVSLDIAYHAPTPFGEPIVARAWLERSEERKQFVTATLHAGEVLVASAKGLFIAIDRAMFLEHLLTKD